MNVLILFLLFASFGVSFEILWTGILDSIKTKNPRLKARSSLWMFPIYGCLLFIIILVRWLYAGYPWWFRGVMYAALIILWEYFSGWIVKKLVGVAPWDYSTSDTYDDVGSKKKFQIGGLVCLEYVPLWFLGGLMAEHVYLFLQSL